MEEKSREISTDTLYPISFHWPYHDSVLIIRSRLVLRHCCYISTEHISRIERWPHKNRIEVGGFWDHFGNSPETKIGPSFTMYKRATNDWWRFGSNKRGILCAIVCYLYGLIFVCLLPEAKLSYQAIFNFHTIFKFTVKLESHFFGT